MAISGNYIITRPPSSIGLITSLQNVAASYKMLKIFVFSSTFLRVCNLRRTSHLNIPIIVLTTTNNACMLPKKTASEGSYSANLMWRVWKLYTLLAPNLSECQSTTFSLLPTRSDDAVFLLCSPSCTMQPSRHILAKILPSCWHP